MTGLRVLVVEDNAVVASDIAVQVENSGNHVCGTAATGAGAIRLGEQLRPDLILMDVNLADGIDGVEAARHIRSRCRAPVIFITGSNHPDVLRRIESFGGAMLLEKPVTAAELARAIARTLADSADA